MKQVQPLHEAIEIYYVSQNKIYKAVRAWFNGKIVWVPQSSDKYLRIYPNELYLTELNNYTDKFYIESNTNWTIT